MAAEGGDTLATGSVRFSVHVGDGVSSLAGDEVVRMSVMNASKESGLEAAAPGSPREFRRALVSDALINQATAQAGDQSVALTGRGVAFGPGQHGQERGLARELDDHRG